VNLQKPDFSEYKRAKVVLYLRAAGLLERRNMDQLIMLVVTIFLQDDEGRCSQESLIAALSDPSTVQIARTLIEKARNG